MPRESDRKPEHRPADTDRVLRLRMRDDLEIVPQKWQGREYQVIKDPITLRYFRFEEEELAILRMLDGTATAESVRARFEEKFAPQRLTNPELYQLIAMLHRSSLVVADAAGQGEKLYGRHRASQQRERRQLLTNPLAIRFRGVDPDRFLTWLNRWCGWFFSWPAVVVAGICGLAALGLVVTGFETLLARLPAFEEFFAGQNWIWLSLVLVLTKIAHELGHGLACKRFGGECNEMGLMFLVLMPCLYCNVSDCWMLPSKWKRAAIAAAGMYVELVLASCATLVWWFSQPGLIHQLSLNVMFVGSVSTLLFNINPLLKYDGYYILSDLVEIPNLRNKATTLLNRVTGSWFLGLENRPDPFLPTRHRWLFAAYAVAAPLYRWVIAFSIFWFLYGVLKPHGLQVIGQLLALMTAGSLVVLPAVQLFRFFSVPGRWWAVKKMRLGLVSGLFLLALAGALFFPVPHRVRCCFFAQPSSATNVFVTVPGFVREIHVRSGEEVKQGQPLMTLENPDLVLLLEQYYGEYCVANAELQHVLKAGSFDRDLQTLEETARSRFETAKNRHDQKYYETLRLVVCAPCSGVFVADSRRPPPDPRATMKLASWHGSPVAPRNSGAWFDSQTRLGRIEQPESGIEVILAVDQGDIEFLREGQWVRLWSQEHPGRILQAKTGQISPARMLTTPPALASRCGGGLVTTQDSDGNDVPQSTTWQVSVPLGGDSAGLVSGATGIALVRVGTQPLVRRLWREFFRTFRFEL